ncbi:MAG: nitrile hydratase accessory protein [Mycobacterium sp.]
MADVDADLEGPVSPPRDNGEIVFAAPWEQRVFGLTIALCRSQVIEWEGFRQSLIRRIAGDPGVPYWQNWAHALEDVLAGKVSRAELDARQHELLTRPAAHDHR